MERWVFEHSAATGPVERLEEVLTGDLPALLRRATQTPEPEGPPEVDGSFKLRLRGHFLVDASGSVTVKTGIAIRKRYGNLRIPIEWRASTPAAPYPSFRGALELEPLGPARAQLSLYGCYSPPLGYVGAALDSIVLSGVAEGTVRALVKALGHELTHELREPAPARAQPSSTRMRVADVLTLDPVTLTASMPLRSAALLLHHLEISGAPVVDDEGQLVGVLSERDVLEKEASMRYGFGRAARESRRRHEAVTVGQACSRPARTTVPDAPLKEAARLMLDCDISRLVVVDGCRVMGIVSRHDVLRALLREDTELEGVAARLLADRGEPDVRVEARWGQLTASGTVTLRSRIPAVVEALTAIDGVISVEADLSWTEDDVMPTVVMPLA